MLVTYQNTLFGDCIDDFGLAAPVLCSSEGTFLVVPANDISAAAAAASGLAPSNISETESMSTGSRELCSRQYVWIDS
jgi:hypothetical protein